MQGRRLPDGPMADHFEPGDYQLSEGATNLYVALPRSPPGRPAFAMLPLGPGGWSVTEEEDGTLTVSPSIHDTDEGGYHGWLERGVWREC
jgi:hypothetical protein